MKALIGVPHLSLLYIRDLIRFTNYSVKIFDTLDKFCFRCDVLLLQGTENIFRHKKQLQNYDGLVFVFDYPDKIIQFKGIQYLESPYDYTYSIISAETLEYIIEQNINNQQDVVITARQYNLIDSVIKRETERNIILHTYTKLVYSIPKVRRAEIKRSIISMLFKTISLKIFQEQMMKFVREKNQEYYDALIDYVVNNPQFVRLQECLVLIKKAKFSEKFDYDGLAKEQDIESYQLTYLSKLYQDLILSKG